MYRSRGDHALQQSDVLGWAKWISYFSASNMLFLRISTRAALRAESQPFETFG